MSTNGIKNNIIDLEYYRNRKIKVSPDETEGWPMAVPVKTWEDVFKQHAKHWNPKRKGILTDICE